MISRHKIGLLGGFDIVAVALYVVVVCIGLLSIVSATYDEGSATPFSFSHQYIKQAIWVGISAVIAIVVMLIEQRYYHMLAYPIYAIGIVTLIAALIFGTEVNGAKAWFEFGSFRVQPAEFVKIGASMAMARCMSNYYFSIEKPSSLLKAAMIIALPLLIIVMQNDTGSGIVLGAFILVLYREGLNNWLCIPVVLVATLFIISFLLSPLVLLVLLIVIFTLCEVMLNRQLRSRLIYLAVIALATIMLTLIAELISPNSLSIYHSLLITTLISLVWAVIYAFRQNLRNTLLLVTIFIGSMVFLPSSDYIFSSILKEHQQSRILSYLGIISDPLGQDYNVNQSKIAIGSGGMWGKGFLNSTQIKYDFVPEQHTDFIFCTIGEEWGFMGTFITLALLCALILRLIQMGERQKEAFGRVYCYCVASILLFHVLVNVGMTVGLMPVMGIPLPFISYGGSSLVAFTILLFIAIRFDAATRQSDGQNI